MFSWVQDLDSSCQGLTVRAAKLDDTSKDVNFCFYTQRMRCFPIWVKRDHFDGFWCPRTQHLNCRLNAFYLFELNCTPLLLFKNNRVCLSPDMFCIDAYGTPRLVRHTFLSILLRNNSIFFLFPLRLVTRKYVRKHFYTKKKKVNKINSSNCKDTEVLHKLFSFVNAVLIKGGQIGLVRQFTLVIKSSLNDAIQQRFWASLYLYQNILWIRV